MTVQAGLCQTWSEPKLLVFSRTGSYVFISDKVVPRNDSVNSDPCLHYDTLTDNNTVCLDNALLTENYTVDNRGDETTWSGSNSVVYWLSFVLICGFLLSTSCCIIAARIMIRCRKLSLSIRYLSVNFLIAFVMIGASTFLCSVIIKIIGQDSQYFLIWFKVRMVLFSVFMSVLWSSVCAVVIERFIAIEFPYHYVKLNKKRTLCSVIVFIWTFNTIIPCLLVVSNWIKFCGANKFLHECDPFALMRPFRIFVASISCICFAVTVIVYSKISISILRQTREERALQVRNTAEQSIQNSITPFASTKTFLIIILSFIVLQFPYLFFSVLAELGSEFRQIDWRIMMSLISSLCHEINVYVTLFLYIWKFSECRMNFYYMFSKLNNKYKTKAENLRLEVYNIVTFEKNINVISDI